MPKYPLLSYHARNRNGEEILNTREGANARGLAEVAAAAVVHAMVRLEK